MQSCVRSWKFHSYYIITIPSVSAEVSHCTGHSMALVGREVKNEAVNGVQRQRKYLHVIHTSDFYLSIVFIPFLHSTKASYCCVLSKGTVLH